MRRALKKCPWVPFIESWPEIHPWALPSFVVYVIGRPLKWSPTNNVSFPSQCVEWAHMQEVGYLGGGGVTSCGGPWEGVGYATRRRARRPPFRNPHPKQPHPHPPPQPLAKKKCFALESNESDDGAIPRPKSPRKPPPNRKGLEACVRTQPQNHPQAPPPPHHTTDTPKDRGDAAAKKGNRPEDPMVGTITHVPYPSR